MAENHCDDWFEFGVIVRAVSFAGKGPKGYKPASQKAAENRSSVFRDEDARHFDSDQLLTTPAQRQSMMYYPVSVS